MSGSSRVDVRSHYFHLSSESPCMNFAMDPEHPDQEQRWHRSWMERGKAWLEQVKPILEQRFALLTSQPDPEWPLVPYEERFPLWNPYAPPTPPPPWRVEFIGMSGPGMTAVQVAFSTFPSEAARERFRQELIKDVALIEQMKGGL